SIQFPPEVQIARAAITASSTTYSTAGTFSYKVSTNACQTDVAAWGAGGAGFDGGNSGGGAGGGGGAFASSTLTNLVIGNSYTLVVGLGGDTSGEAGTNSTFDGTVVVADAGGGGTSATTGEGAAGLASASTGDVTRNGGVGGSGNGGDDAGGGGGGAAGPHGDGGAGGDADATQGGGGGGGNGGTAGGTPTGGTSTNGGAGGLGDSNGTTAPPGGNGTANANGGGGGGGGDQADEGGNGGAPGGGGGGGENLHGNGANGQIIITEYINDQGCVVAPTVTTGSASGITGATLGGNITATGGSNATVRGFAWGTDSSLSTVFATTTESGSFGTGAFGKQVSGLISGTIYYFRAYATNSAGTGYGSIANFTAGSDTAPTRKLRLFEGYKIKLISGKIILHQKR
ncbi:MAG TPA: hypothetical protein VD928_01255, partial [Candidatus Paceibacterota bacterium]|nr:hypothetical protein [Candidatus Paceibacterota bacterium]